MIKTELIKVKSIVADKDQPRKFFNELRLKDLANSIKKYGIKTPITVEDYGNGKYLLVDGERRYRASLQLGLTEMPAIIKAPQKASERLIEQFHLQEQHEGWNSLEKANAINQLAKDLEMNLPEIVELLNLPAGTVRTYMAVASLLSRDKFESSNVPLNWIPAIAGLKNKTRALYENINKEKFTRTDEKSFENGVLKGIQSNSINHRADLARLGDVFETKPETIKKFLDGNLNVETAYFEADAMGTHALRSSTYTARYLIKNIARIIESKSVKLKDGDKSVFISLKKSVDSLVKFIEE